MIISQFYDLRLAKAQTCCLLSEEKCTLGHLKITFELIISVTINNTYLKLSGLLRIENNLYSE